MSQPVSPKNDLLKTSQNFASQLFSASTHDSKQCPVGRGADGVDAMA
jgi:hypothetical protein